MGAPGWPELAFCTASMARVRMVLMLRVVSCLLVRACSLATIEKLLPSAALVGSHCIPVLEVYQVLVRRVRPGTQQNPRSPETGKADTVHDLLCRMMRSREGFSEAKLSARMALKNGN